ncbi:MAG: DUF4330 family protein [Ruminococcaceae bacterium]|nr:DUF4330 family protein [Oscillospiraceae bacterium]
MTEKKIKKFKFNFVDLLFLLIIVAASAVLFYIFRPNTPISDTSVSNNKEIVYTIEAREVRSEFKGNVNIGDSVVDSVGLHPIGEVVDITYTEAPFVYKADGSGEMIYSVYPDKINISIKVKATADVSGGTYSIGGFVISVGERVYFRTPDLTGESFCTSIEITEGE